MKTLIQDGGMFVFEDGYKASTAQEFVDKIEAEYQESLEKEEEWGILSDSIRAMLNDVTRDYFDISWSFFPKTKELLGLK